ncbi:hypothetical protein AAFF_G00103730 [Aldrovandia affinis]|uniref:Uncharacterized protein n=1 Tax=Aldrovandia affinis TaxID=143900 RepID=A0AAD7RUJ9_9TELE|nr:hypothetical protein AAFF_G00103730 [Aldrovandia affinis]
MKGDVVVSKYGTKGKHVYEEEDGPQYRGNRAEKEIKYLANGSWRPIREDEKSMPECLRPDISSPMVNGHSPAHTSSSQSGAGTPAGGFVLELTDDMFKEGGGGMGDSEDTDDSQDSPPLPRPMSIQ